MAIFPRLPGVSRCQKKSSSGLYGARGDIRDRPTNNPAGCHFIWTNQRSTSIIPTFLRRMTFRLQPSKFILAWDRHQLCWLGCLVEGKGLVHKGRLHRGGRFKLNVDISGQGEVFTTGQSDRNLFSIERVKSRHHIRGQTDTSIMASIPGHGVRQNQKG